MKTLILEPDLLDCWSEKNRFALIMQMQGTVYREIEKRITLKFTHNQQNYFIKKHHGIPATEWLKSILFGCASSFGARNEVNLLNRLHQLGIKAPLVAGFGEQGRNPLNKQSFIITREVFDVLGLDTYESKWKNQELTWKMKQYLLYQIASITRTLHQNGINHRDLYACHFMVLQTDAVHPDVTLMDLHRAAIWKKIPIRWIIKDLASLYYSIWNFNITKRDIYRFIQYYSGRAWRVEITESLVFWSAVKKRTRHFIKRHSKFFTTPLNNVGE
ncbi:MAG: lipopolysaccharide core heptose(I) kinase RfaP [Legionellales bacterium]|nr:lipopolysaccharide core heptose(I) kinase RfaP [Legionellales bacterium]